MSKYNPIFGGSDSNKKVSRKQEERASKLLSVRLTPGSGTAPFLSMKADGQDSPLVVECKVTKHATRKVGGEELETLSAIALQQGKEPVFFLTLEGINPPTTKDWVMIPADYFQYLYEYLKAIEEARDGED